MQFNAIFLLFIEGLLYLSHSCIRYESQQFSGLLQNNIFLVPPLLLLTEKNHLGDEVPHPSCPNNHSISNSIKSCPCHLAVIATVALPISHKHHPAESISTSGGGKNYPIYCSLIFGHLKKYSIPKGIEDRTSQ